MLTKGRTTMEGLSGRGKGWVLGGKWVLGVEKKNSPDGVTGPQGVAPLANR